MEDFEIQFLGAAQTVTGSKTLIKSKEHGNFLVDCGLFQGLKELRKLNYESLPTDPKNIDAVFLTHAHLDHCGYIPLLVKSGYRGPIYCSQQTIDLAQLILKDSAHVQEEDAIKANAFQSSKHEIARPLYDTKDVIKCFPLFKPLPTGQTISLRKGIQVHLIPNGHILGSVAVWLKIGSRSFLFSGDLGRKKPLLLHAPEKPMQADTIVIESTYGDRCHPLFQNDLNKFRQIINDTYEAKGHLLIPSFSVGRAQEVLYLIAKLRSENKIPQIPVYLDSPMAIEATNIFLNSAEWSPISKDILLDIHEHVIQVPSASKSLELAGSKKPAIIVAGSGMLTGGRMLNYLVTKISKKNTTLLFVGYQAPGTRGRLIRDGAQDIKVYGHYLQIKARVESIDSLSAHADQSEILEWLSKMKRPKQAFINHGETQASEALLIRMRDYLGWKATVPCTGATYVL